MDRIDHFGRLLGGKMSFRLDLILATSYATNELVFMAKDHIPTLIQVDFLLGPP